MLLAARRARRWPREPRRDLPRSSSRRLRLRRTRRRLADYLAALGISHVYCSPYLQAAPGQHARLRRRRPRARQRGAGRRGGLRRAAARRSAAHGLGHAARHRPQPHGDRRPREPLVVGRARERPVEPLRRATSTSTGTRPRRGCATWCCCRSSATTTAACSRRRAAARRATAARFVVRYHEHACRSRPRSLGRPAGAAAAGAAGSDELAFIADALGAPAAAPRPPTAAAPRGATATRRSLRAQLAAPAARATPRGRRGRRRRGRRELNARPGRARRAARAPELPPRLLARGRAATSATAASSTSTRWSACASRTSASSRDTHALVLALAARAACVDGAAHRPSRRPARSRAATSARLREARAGRLDRGREDPRAAASSCRATGRSTAPPATTS